MSSVPVLSSVCSTPFKKVIKDKQEVIRKKKCLPESGKMGQFADS